MGFGTLEKGSNIYSGYILKVDKDLRTGFAEGVCVGYEKENSRMTKTGPEDIGGVN